MPLYTRKAEAAGLSGDLIPPDARPRVDRSIRAVLSPASVVDAEFEEIVGEPTRAAFRARAEAAAAYTPDAPSMFAGIRQSDRATLFSQADGAHPPVAISAPVFWATIAAVSFLTFWVSGGHVLAGRFAGDAGALTIADVVTRVVEADGRRVLIVDGRIENNARRGLAVPMIVLAAGDDREPALLHPGRSFLGAGEKLAFQGRLAAPQEARAELTLSFAEGVGVQPAVLK